MIKVCTKCKEKKELTLFHKDRSNKDGYHYWCKECKKVYQKSYMKTYCQKNKEKLRASNRKWQRDNKEKFKEKLYASQTKYRKKNLPKHAALRSKYRARKVQATPSWSELPKIEELYKLAKLLEAESLSGKRYDVDHIVPLKNKHVSGLHVLANMRVISASENRRKHNHHVYDS